MPEICGLMYARRPPSVTSGSARSMYTAAGTCSTSTCRRDAVSSTSRVRRSRVAAEPRRRRSRTTAAPTTTPRAMRTPTAMMVLDSGLDPASVRPRIARAPRSSAPTNKPTARRPSGTPNLRVGPSTWQPYVRGPAPTTTESDQSPVLRSNAGRGAGQSPRAQRDPGLIRTNPRPWYGFRGEGANHPVRLGGVPVPGGTVIVIVVIGLAVLLSLRILLVVPTWVRRVRRPETRAIRVVGVGGGGNNAVDRMVTAGVRDVSFVGFNTDAQALRRSTAAMKIRIGQETTGGLGSGGDPRVGRRAAEEDAKWIASALAGADLVFVTAGLGRRTGSGAGPNLAP